MERSRSPSEMDGFDNQGHTTRRLEVFERCQAYGSTEAVFGEKKAAPQERSSLRSSAATEDRRPYRGIYGRARLNVEPGVSKY